ncbi:MAG TPA: hypothetical protein VML75_03850 [Kofleriaceae bacterium]|nr:hypothetical protein [Kofleriaceae bacterium]
MANIVIRQWQITVAAIAAIAACACGGKQALDAATEKQVRECALGLAAMSDTDGSRNAVLMADACSAANPAFAQLATADASQKLVIAAEHGGFFCPGKAGEVASSAPANERMHTLVSGCGPAYYGLPADAGWALSLEWFITQRVGAWLGPLREGAGGDLRQLIDAGMATARVPLPIPSRLADRYTAPNALDNDLVFARAFVLVAADGVTAGAAPAAQLTAGGASLASHAGKSFPGAPVEAPKLREALVQMKLAPPAPPMPAPPVVDDEAKEAVPVDTEEAKEPEPRSEGRYQMKSHGMEPQLARRVAIEKARNAGILGAGVEGQSMGFTGPGGTLLPRIGPDAPLLIADAGLPATRLDEAVRGLADLGATIGVSSRSGVTVRHSIPVQAAAGGWRLAVALRGPRTVVVVDGQVIAEVEASGGRLDFDRLNAAIEKVGRESGRQIAIQVGEGVTVQDLVTVLDIAATAGVRSAALVTPGVALVSAAHVP